MTWCLSHTQLWRSYNRNRRLPSKELYSKSPPVQTAQRQPGNQMHVCLEEAREVLSHLRERNESSEGLCSNGNLSSNINKTEAGPRYSPVLFARTNDYPRWIIPCTVPLPTAFEALAEKAILHVIKQLLHVLKECLSQCQSELLWCVWFLPQLIS